MGFTKEMFSPPPRPSRKVMNENDEIIGSNTFCGGSAAKSSNHESDSPSRDPSAAAQSGARFEFPSKIRRLPNIWKELELTGAAYKRLKGEYHVLGLCVSATEMIVRFWSALVLFVACSPPLSGATDRVMAKLRIVDEFSCHQLDFLEEQMNKNEYGSIYKDGGFAERFEFLVRLVFRVTFIVPRLCVRMFYVCVNCVGDEFVENIELLSNVVEPPMKVRISARQKKSKSLEKSPGKKRKIAEVTEEKPAGELPYYFEEKVDYVEEEDDDFDPKLETADEDSDDEEIDTQEEDTQEEDTQEEEEDEDEEDEVVESCRDEVDENENTASENKIGSMSRNDSIISAAAACPLPETPTM